MINQRLNLAVVSLLALVSSTPTFAQTSPNSAAVKQANEIRPELTARQLEIMRTIRSVDGYIDEALHREFWSLMPSVMRNSPSAHQMLEDLFAEVGAAREEMVSPDVV